MQIKVTAPTPVTDKVVGVPFVDGVATVDPDVHRSAVAYFGRHAGYRVEQIESDPAPAVAAEETKPPARSASKADWRAYAITQGMAEADAEAATRDELAERYLGPKEA